MPDQGGPVVEKDVPFSETQDPEGKEQQEPSLLKAAKDGDEEARRRVAARIMRSWTQQDTEHRGYREEWRVNKLRRKGVSNVKLVEGENRRLSAYAPPSINMMPHTLNKADRLCRRINSFLFTDPPIPEAVPARDDDEARDSAETSTRILQSMTAEGDIDDVRTARRAFDVGCTYDSGFRHHYVDRMGGGSRAMEVMVHPLAQALPEAVPVPLDPTTGQPFEGPYVSKYVTESAELTDDRGTEGLRFQFIPAIKTEVLDGRHVRFLPSSANDIWDADGVLIGSFQRLGLIKHSFEAVEKLEPEELKKLIQEPPEDVASMLPGTQRRTLQTQDINDDALIFVLTHYRKQGGTEPKGVYAVVLGRNFLAHIQPWVNPKTGEPMDIPVDQFKHFENEDSPYGRGLMRQLGGGNELLGQGYEAVVTHMRRLKNRRVFIPTNSIVQPKQLQSATGTAIAMNPGGKPEYEEVPPMPPQYFDYIRLLNDEMNDESALQEVAQGINTPSVQSGLHARQIIEQANVSLSDLRQNVSRALVRGYRIYLQLAKAYFTVPQELQYIGDDGQHKLERWTGTTFQDTRDVRLSKGSFTQLSPPAKAAEAERFFGMVDETTGERMLSLAELRNLVMGNVGGLIGIQDNPHRQRIRRQINVWQQGPPEGFDDAFAQRQQAEQEAQKIQQAAQQLQQQAEQTGEQPPPEVLQQLQQALQGPQQILSQPLPTAFEPSPTDEEQDVARLRHFELARAMVGTMFAKQPPEWQQGLVETYQQARAAAGIQTIQEQQEAAQAEAEAAQAAQQAQQQGDQAQQQAAQQEAEAGRQADAATQQSELQRAQIDAQPSVDIKVQAEV